MVFHIASGAYVGQIVEPREGGFVVSPERDMFFALYDSEDCEILMHYEIVCPE